MKAAPFGLLFAGWLANALAGPDKDVVAALAAYEAGQHDRALERLDAAQARRGPRAELEYNRGLVLLAKGDTELARAAFERGIEAEELGVRASSHYELGNLEYDAEAWEAAIAAYRACLETDPTHANAKWNLELALAKQEAARKEQEEEEQEEEGEPGQEEEGQEGEQGEEGEEKEDEGAANEEDDDGSKEAGEATQEPGEPEEQEGEDPESKAQQDEEGQEPGEPGQEDPQAEPERGGPKEGGDEEAPAEATTAAQPLDRAAIGEALEALDQQDDFMLGRALGGAGARRVEKDW